MSKFVIIDGNAIIHRSYHAIPPLTTKEGTMVNAVYGFTTMLLRVMQELKPTYLAATFDVAGGTFRHAKYKEYKATRVKADQALYDQIPLVHDLVKAFNIPIYEKKGFEADDVIGTIAKNILGHKKDIETFILTGDMDALQLVDEHTRVYTLRHGLSEMITYDPEAVKKRYGFGPEKMVDYKALRGDPSDNIPGVPGVGEKTATELIQNVGGIEAIYEQIERLGDPKIKGYKIKESVVAKLKAGQESARLSRELATIDCDVPDLKFDLDSCELKPFDREKLAALFQKFEFTSLIKRIPGAANSNVGGFDVEANKNFSKVNTGSFGKSGKKKTGNFVFVEIGNKQTEVVNKATVTELAEKIIKLKKFASQAVSSGKDVFTSELLGLLIVIEANGYFVPPHFFEELKVIFTHPEIEIMGHDLKALIKIAARNGLEITNKLYDVMMASYLLGPGSRAHDAASIVFKTLGHELTAAAGQESLFGVDYRRHAEELFLVAEAGEQLRQELKKINNYGLLETIEMPLIPVLAELELNGVAVDLKKLAELSKRVAKNLAAVEKKIHELAGKEFNVASPTQLREILFETLQIPVVGIKKGKTGLSTSAEQLEKMRGLHPIIEEVEQFRELAKLQNTYVDVLPTLVNPVTHRLHTTFNQAVAATGRLSSTDPNLQNIPIRTELGREIREAFVSERGNVLLSADYSQIELRVVASLAEDEHMLEIFRRGEDIHTATAAAINGVALEAVTKDMRRAAKEINFGILYGMGTHGLSWRAEISYADAKAFIEKYFGEFAGVKKYIDRTIAFAAQEGYCETLFGRRRYLPELQAKNFQLRAAAERMAVNHPIQGTAADLMKMGLIAASSALKKLANKEIKLLLQVHDELVAEVPVAMVHDIGKMLREAMQNVAVLRVPIEVNISQGRNWGKMEKI